MPIYKLRSMDARRTRRVNYKLKIVNIENKNSFTVGRGLFDAHSVEVMLIRQLQFTKKKPFYTISNYNTIDFQLSK